MMNEDIQEVLLSRQLKIQLNNFDSVFFWSYEKHIQIRVSHAQSEVSLDETRTCARDPTSESIFISANLLVGLALDLPSPSHKGKMKKKNETLNQIANKS